MTDPDPHDQLLAEYGDDYSPAEARADSLGNADYTELRSVAARLNVHAVGDTASDLCRKLGEEGVFYGAVGDDQMYRFDGETTETVVTPA